MNKNTYFKIIKIHRFLKENNLYFILKELLLETSTTKANTKIKIENNNINFINGEEVIKVDLIDDTLSFQKVEQVTKIKQLTLDVTNPKPLFKINITNLELRENGLIVTETTMAYNINLMELISLESTRFIYTTRTLMTLFPNIELPLSYADILLKINNHELDHHQSDLRNTIEISLNSDTSSNSLNSPVRTLVNKNDISNIYTLAKKNAVLRIFDLYNGKITPRVLLDIKDINLGCLKPEAFNYRSLNGITWAEEKLIGKKNNNYFPTTSKYIEKLLLETFFIEVIDLDNREELLSKLQTKKTILDKLKINIKKKIKTLTKKMI